eukprot:snap_masked-scaffold261_size233860-processed-gene-1.1 protein:Tk10682 transcript:snap_masked-scaffold261_size233860-processed-gene-1.1-mRNA-1 annotation:"AGAP001862-PA"
MWLPQRLQGNNLKTTFYANEKTHEIPLLPIMDKMPMFEVVVHGFLILIVSIVGITGNILCLMVLGRPTMRNSINCLLMGVAIIDMVLITSAVALFSLPTLQLFLEENYGISTEALNLYQFTPILYPMAMIAQTASVYLTVAIAFERYIVVCRPFLSRSLCTFGRSQRFVGVVIFFAILYNIPRFFEYELRSQTVDLAGTTTLVYLQSTDLRDDPLYIALYMNWMYMIFMYLLPFSILFYLNLRIGLELRRARLARIHMTSAQKNEEGCAIMLIIVVVIFILANSPAMASNIVESLGYEAIELTQISNLLVVFNSSIYIFVYNIFSQKFRKICYRVLTCTKPPRFRLSLTNGTPGDLYRNNSKTIFKDQEDGRPHVHKERLRAVPSLDSKASGSESSCSPLAFQMNHEKMSSVRVNPLERSTGSDARAVHSPA